MKHRKTAPTMLLAAIAGFAVATESTKAAEISISTTAPTVDAMDVSNLAPGTGTQKWFDDVEHDAGQTFTPTSDGLLQSFTIYLSKGNPNDAGNENVDVRFGTISRPGGVFTFTDVYSENAAMAPSPGGDWAADDYITFTFDTPPAVTAGVEYGIITDAQSMGDWHQGIPYRHKTGNVYAGGSLINRGGEITNSDLVFHADIVPATPDTFQLVITPNASTTGNYDFSWASQDGKVYDLVSAADLSTAPDTWPVYLGNENIPGAAPTNTLMDVTGGGDPGRFFAMIEKDPPPLFSEDFEADNGGFTVATTQGTDWAHGTPDSNGLGGSVTGGNGGSTNCWGTNLGAYAGGAGDRGFYADPTDTCLRSAVIDLTGVTAAELTFAQALDLEGGDTVTVNIIDDTTDTVISADIVTITDTDTSTALWESIGPVAIPAPALGQPVRIEWCLSGVGGTTDDYMGWYIDDVAVTQTTP